MAAELGLTVAAWGVLGAGVLTGRPTDTLRWPGEPSERTRAVLAALQEIAAARDATPAQVAIAWLLDRDPPPVVPIVGVRRLAQLDDDLGALALDLTAEERAALDEVGAPSLGFPRAFLESDDVRELIYGDMWGCIAPLLR
jgi:aryl-alcohol dehydrogenase-like predicted oxidoreductase